MNLKISDQLSLPPDAATQKIAFLGRTGSGKTYGAGVMVELMLDRGNQVVILDPVGVWYGLRMPRELIPGYAIPVFGGLHGDIPLESTGGALVADLIVEKGMSIVLDVSQFESDAEKARFARAFADRFFFLKKANPSPVHLVIEECQEFIPQDPRGDEAHMVHAFTRMWKLGRNFGIGGSLITQRPQEVSKKVLNQTELLFAFQMTGTHERKAIREWASDKGVDRDLVDELPGLAVGTCFAWSPQWLRFNDKISFRQKKTVNTSSTPDSRERARSRDVTPVDLEDIAEKMKVTVERAKENDPRELKAKIARLEALLAKKPEPQIERRTTPVIDVESLKRLESVRSDFSEAMELIDSVKGLVAEGLLEFQNVRRSVDALTSEKEKNSHLFDAANYATQRHTSRIIDPTFRVPKDVDRSMHEPIDGKLGKCERAILTALAQLGPSTRARVSIVSGYSGTSSSFANALGALRRMEFIEGSDPLQITRPGEAALGAYRPLPTGRELVAYWCANLPKCEAVMLAYLCDGHETVVSKEELAAGIGYSETSSSFANALSKLRTLELINRGPAIRASESLFD